MFGVRIWVVSFGVPERAAVIGIGEVSLLKHRKLVDGRNPFERVSIADDKRSQLVDALGWQLLDAGS